MKLGLLETNTIVKYISDHPDIGKSDISKNAYDLNKEDTFNQLLDLISNENIAKGYELSAVYDNKNNITGINVASLNESFEIEIPENSMQKFEKQIMKNREGKPGINLETGKYEDKINQFNINQKNNTNTNQSDFNFKKAFNAITGIGQTQKTQVTTQTKTLGI